MAKYYSDTESESYRYDDSNNSSDESVTDLDIPEFNDKKAIEIAEYLDSKYHISTQSTSAQCSENKTFQSPSTDKIWTPLSQSTPADIPTTKVQPKDILKARSKLSRLSANANGSIQLEGEDDNDADTDDERDDSEESSRASSFHEDTPSKTNKKKLIIENAEKKKIEAEMKELEELRQLKRYITSLPNGSTIVDCSKNLKNAQSMKVIPQSEIDKTDKQTQSLKELVSNVTNQNSDLKEENSILRSSNTELKQTLELKNESINDIKDNFKATQEKLIEAQQFKEELELKSKDLELRLKELVGDPESSITPQKHPSLNFKTASGKPVYEQLELELVDSLNLIESHNIIKNILINLLIPLTETKQTIPKLSRLLQNEDVLCEFTNRLHNLLYQQELNISKFQTELDGYVSLRQCTSQMYKNVELLYQTSVTNEL